MSDSTARTSAWIVGGAVFWGVVTVFVGLGTWTTYALGYIVGLRALLLEAQRGPAVIAGAAVGSFLLLWVVVRFLGAPRRAWLGVPLVQVLIAVVLGIVSWLHVDASMRLAALGSFLGSELIIGLLATAAAFLGAYVGSRPGRTSA